MKKKYNLPCNIANTLDLIGDRWTLLIVRDLLAGKTKFNELKQSLAGIAPNILSDRLQVLEKEELVHSNLYSKHPPRYEYELTEDGKKLEHVLNALAMWGNRHFQQKYYDITIPGCGHEAEIAYACKECGTTADHVHYKTASEPTK